MYALVENNVAIEAKSKPNWFHDDGSPVTDSFLVEQENIYPIVYNPPTIDKTRQKLIIRPMIEWSVKDTYVEATYRVENKTLVEIQTERIREIENIKNTKLETMEYTLPAGDIVTVKIAEDAPDKPRQSWLSMTINKAMIAVVNSEDFSETLIDAQDNEHILTANDWLDFGKCMQERIVGLVRTAKIDIENIKSFTAVEPILNYNALIEGK